MTRKGKEKSGIDWMSDGLARTARIRVAKEQQRWGAYSKAARRISAARIGVAKATRPTEMLCDGSAQLRSATLNAEMKGYGMAKS